MGALFLKVAKVPGPQEAFGENDDCGSKDCEADSWRSVAKRIASASKKNERQVAKPAKRHKRLDHRTTSVIEPVYRGEGLSGKRQELRVPNGVRKSAVS